MDSFQCILIHPCPVLFILRDSVLRAAPLWNDCNYPPCLNLRTPLVTLCGFLLP
jgi:hypothetical protein